MGKGFSAKGDVLASHDPLVGPEDSITMSKRQGVSEPEMRVAANSRLSVLLHTDLKLLLYNAPKMLA